MTLELIAAAVLGLDAAVIAAVVFGRLRARRAGDPWSSASRPADPSPPETAPSPGWHDDVGSTAAEPAPAADAGRLAGWQSWVDPLTMAAEATAAWRRALRRDLLRAGSRRRGGAVLHVELDTPDGARGDATRLEGALLDAIGAVVRPTDHFDHTGPGRFHVLLWDASTASARAVGQRIEDAFGRSAAGPHGTRLVVGVEAVTSEDEVSGAIQRAADQVAKLRGRVSEGGTTG